MSKDEATVEKLVGMIERGELRLPEMQRRYLPPYIEKNGADAFKAQCIPIGARFLEVGTYKPFLTERRRAMVERLNTFLASPILP